MTMKKIIIILLLFFSSFSFCTAKTILTGAEQTALYLPLLKNKRVAVFANHSSLIQKTHLIDALKKNKIHVVKIFAPEHGFRGNTDGGEKIQDTIDPVTQIPVISLYGKKLKPTADDLHDVDIILFDIQDVGARFYTYISSLQYLLEAAAENHKPVIIFDRPNPNGFYVDGPVLKQKYKSFIGMQPIPIVHGMTIGEYAKMLVGEKWLNVKPTLLVNDFKLTVIPCKHYTHQDLYEPPVKPSPNLPNIQSIYWYPSLALFEGTVVSMGRGTDMPFQVLGHPLFKKKFSFIPQSKVGEKHPLYQNQICYGWNLVASKKNTLQKIDGKLQIKYLMTAYQNFPDKTHFFHRFRYFWGSDDLPAQLQTGMTEKEIRHSWEPELSQFKVIRKKYLIYPEA